MNKLKDKIFAWILKRQAARTVIMPQWEKARIVAVLYPNDNIQHFIKQKEDAEY
jgi:hypothetical protein